MRQIRSHGKVILRDVDLFIFDKDGTLTDVHLYWTSMIFERADFLIEKFFRIHAKKKEIHSTLVSAMGIDEENRRMKREGPVGIKPRSFIVDVTRRVLHEWGIQKTNEMVESYFKEVDEKTKTKMNDFVKELPGVKAFLKACKVSGIKLAVGTSDMTNRAKSALKSAGMDSYFDYIIGGDQVTMAKPEPEMIEFLLKKTGISPKKTVMVGDHPVDILMGQKAGLGGNLGVLTGLGTLDDFKELNCPVIESFDELEVHNDK